MIAKVLTLRIENDGDLVNLAFAMSRADSKTASKGILFALAGFKNLAESFEAMRSESEALKIDNARLYEILKTSSLSAAALLDAVGQRDLFAG